MIDPQDLNHLIIDATHGLGVDEVYTLIGAAPAASGAESLVRLNCQLSSRINKWSKYKPIVPKFDTAAALTPDQRRETNPTAGEYYGVKLLADAAFDIAELRSWNWSYRSPVRGQNWARLSDWVGYHHTVGPYPDIVPMNGEWAFGLSGTPMDVSTADRGYRLTLRLATDQTRAQCGVNCVEALVGEQWATLNTSLHPVLIISRGDTLWCRAMNVAGSASFARIDLSDGLVDVHCDVPLDLKTVDASGSWVDPVTARPYCRKWLQAVGCNAGSGVNNEFAMAESLKAVLTQSTVSGSYLYMAVVLINTESLQNQNCMVSAPDPNDTSTTIAQPLDLTRWVPIHKLEGGALGWPCIPIPIPYGSGSAYRCLCPVRLNGTGQAPIAPAVSVSAERSSGAIDISATISTQSSTYDYTFTLRLIFAIAGSNYELTVAMHVATGRDDVPTGTSDQPVRYQIYPADLGLHLWPAGTFTLNWKAYADADTSAAPINIGTISGL